MPDEKLTRENFRLLVREALCFDELSLPREWALQAERVFAIGQYVADCHQDVDYAEADLKLTEAEIDQDVRSNPESFGIEKVTEPAIKAAVLGHRRRQKVLDKLIRLKHDAKVADVAMVALEHKKRAMEKYQDGRTSGLFAEPRTNRDGYQLFEERNKKAARRAMREGER